MAWTISFTETAFKQLSKLPKNLQQDVQSFLRDRVIAKDNPRSSGKALRYGKKGLWRYRVGKYRVICEIQDERLHILVITVGKRDKVYL